MSWILYTIWPATASRELRVPFSPRKAVLDADASTPEALLDRRLHALRLRDDTLARVGLPAPVAQSLRWLDKTVVDVDDLLPGCRVPCAQIAHVLILGEPGSPQSSDDQLSIRLDHTTPAFMARLRRLPGVLHAEETDGGRYPLLRLQTEQRMLTLARVLVLEPRLLIADELSLGLAPIITTEVYVVLEQILERGTSLLVVEQHLDHALGVAHEVVALERGQTDRFLVGNVSA